MYNSADSYTHNSNTTTTIYVINYTQRYTLFYQKCLIDLKFKLIINKLIINSVLLGHRVNVQTPYNIILPTNTENSINNIISSNNKDDKCFHILW